MILRQMPWFAFCVGSALATLLAFRFGEHEADVARLRFERLATVAEAELQADFSYLEQVTKRGRAFATGRIDLVDANQWHAFTSFITDDAQSRSLRAMSLILPRGGDHYIIHHIDPVPPGIEKPLGLDLSSNPQRRSALERARDSGEPELTGIVPQALALPAAPGAKAHENEVMIIYLAVYDDIMAPSDVPRRRESLRGWVSLGFSPIVLARGIWAAIPELDIDLFDVTTPDHPVEIFGGENDPRDQEGLTGDDDALFHRDVSLSLGGRNLLLRLHSTPAFEQENVHAWHRALIIGGGVTLSGLLAGLFRLLSRRRADAVALAHTMTATLRERERRLAEAERTARIGSWELDHLKKTIVWSDEHYRLLGISPSSTTATYEAFFDSVDSEHRTWLKPLFEETICEKRDFEAEYRIIRRSDGVERWLKSRGVHEWDAQGRVLRSRGTSMDITPFREIINDLIKAKVSAEVARREEKKGEMRFRDFALCSADGFWEADQYGRFISYSEAIPKISTRDVLGMTHSECFGKEERNGLLINRESAELYIELTTSRQPVRNLEFGFQAGPDDFRTVSISGVPVYDENGDFLGYRGVTHDITEQKRAELALAEQVDMLNAMTDASSDAIVIIDDGGLVSFWNPAAERIFGYHPDEAIGQDAHILIGGEGEHGAFQKARPEFQRTGRGAAIGRTLELSARRKDGRRLPVEMTVSSFRSHGLWHAVGVIRDISERKDIERQFWQNQKMESIGTLAGGIAHDINNMLQPVLGITAVVIEDLPVDDPRRDDLGMVMVAAERIKSLVEGILAFSRKEDIKREILDIVTVVQDTVPLLRATLPASLEIRASTPERALLVTVDPTQIQAMLMNLAGNAADAMAGRHGYLDIHLARITASEELARVVPRIAAHRPYAFLRVKDNGCGMDSRTLERIFDPFFTTKDVGKGTGLGLSIVQRMVTKYDGAIVARSMLGFGTAFEIYLPIAATKAAADGPERVSLTNKEGTMVSDDDHDSAQGRSLASSTL